MCSTCQICVQSKCCMFFPPLGCESDVKQKNLHLAFDTSQNPWVSRIFSASPWFLMVFVDFSDFWR
jgi:hypothetical protein